MNLVACHMSARLVQTGHYRDVNGQWLIISVETTRDGQYVFVLKKPGRRGGRWKTPPINGDSVITVYKEDAE